MVFSPIARLVNVGNVLKIMSMSNSEMKNMIIVDMVIFSIAFSPAKELMTTMTSAKSKATLSNARSRTAASAKE